MRWLTYILLLTATTALADGTIIFNNRVYGSLITHVYLGGNYTIYGNGPGDTPAGTTDWSGYTALSGSGWYAGLLGAPGANMPENALLASPTVTYFRTGAAAGKIMGTTAVLPNVPNDAAVATLQMVVWDNHSGLYPTWSQAEVAWQNGAILAGKSNPFTVWGIGGDFNVPPVMTGLLSFNIPIPEPGSMCLLGLGAAALAWRRRV